jgi:hypothetical protein
MKSRTALFLLLGLLMLVLGGISFHFSPPEQEVTPVLHATVDRDCAPWDGAAFTVHVPLEDGNSIEISIWQAPDIDFRATFSFPDEAAQVGNALWIHPDGPPEELGGTVRFQAVDQGHPVQGEFELRSETGERFMGTFKAEWGAQIAMCG